MGKNMVRNLAIALSLLITSNVQAINFAEREEVKQFVDEMVSEHKIDRKQVMNAFAKIESSAEVIQRITTPYEALPWDKYRTLFLSEQKINGGVKFWQQYANILEAAEKSFGVPAELIVAIIGVESAYGVNRGKYPVLQALATLAFDYPPRSKFFRSELKEYLLLTREHKLDPLELKGSYAGAMGSPQFIASSYRNFAVDFDNSGSIDLINNMTQAIGSVANYFKVHGWQPGQEVIVKANIKGQKYRELHVASKNDPKPILSLDTLRQYNITTNSSLVNKTSNVAFLAFEQGTGNEYWLGLPNFYVITRYNHSSNYAMAVYQLSQAIAKLFKQQPTTKING